MKLFSSVVRRRLASLSDLAATPLPPPLLPPPWWTAVSRRATVFALTAGLGAAVVSCSSAPVAPAAETTTHAEPSAEEQPPAEAAETPVAAPISAAERVFTRKEVAEHNTLAKRMWVTVKDGVYDVTDFVPLHPGGDKICLAAGAAVDPFWVIYQQHKGPHVEELLRQYRIGVLDPADAASLSSALASVGDPYRTDPPRSALLSVRSAKPFNGEPPAVLLPDNYVTPEEMLFVRNHLPVPEVDSASYSLRVLGPGLPSDGVSLSLSDLKRKFPRVEVTAALTCAGNRRAGMGSRSCIDPTAVRGLGWDVSAMGNLVWAGARLRDVLLYAGLREEEIGRSIRHVHFEGLDHDPASGVRYAASIPADKAVSPTGDVLLAYELNGHPISRDHGFPLRAVVPGITGARQVKWLGRVIMSANESDSLWQVKDYKAFAPYVDWDNVDFTTMPAIQEMPVTSAICEPRDGARLPPGSSSVTVKGFAWSGGGRAITRVDVSSDGGRSWLPTEIVARPDDASPSQSRSWGWTLWTAEVPVPAPAAATAACSSAASSAAAPSVDSATATAQSGAATSAISQTSDSSPSLPPAQPRQLELVCKAVDSSYNVQPDTPSGIWNFRGLMNNTWHRVIVHVPQSDDTGAQQL